MSRIIKIPTWESAAEMTYEGIRNAAIADAATLGYESRVVISSKSEIVRVRDPTCDIV